MSKQPTKKGLVILAADKDMEETCRGLLDRRQSLQVRPLTYEIYRHPQRDPGCFLHCHDFLRPFANLYLYAVVVFDRDGCGRENLTREELERETERRLSRSGWEKRAAVVVPAPELEIWIWSDSPKVDEVLGWVGQSPDLRSGCWIEI